MQAVTPFQTEKPKPKPVRVVAIDDETGKSKSATVYDTTPEAVIAWLKGEPKGAQPGTRRRATQR